MFRHRFMAASKEFEPEDEPVEPSTVESEAREGTAESTP